VKSLSLILRGIFSFQSVKVPVIYTDLPPPVQENTVGMSSVAVPGGDIPWYSLTFVGEGGGDMITSIASLCVLLGVEPFGIGIPIPCPPFPPPGGVG